MHGGHAALDRRAQLLHRATNASVATAVVLACGKAAAFGITGSVAVLASLIDSLMDASASLINAFAVRYSLKPADADHRFGHGKSEAIAGLAQAAFIAVSAAFLVVQAIDRLIHPKPLQAIPIGLAVMVGSILLTSVLVWYQRRVVRATQSHAIRADSLHFVSDLAANLSTVVALGFSAAGVPQMDPIFGIGIALATFYGAVRIGRDTLHVLMDRELADEVQERIRAIALAHDQVLGVHDLRTRQSGPTKLIQFHLEMDGAISLLEAHRISDEVERAIRDAFPEADVVIHEDPAGLHEQRQFP